MGVFAVAACGDEPAQSLPPTPNETPETPQMPAVDQTQAFFNSQRVFRVEIQLDPADWDMIRRQARSFPQLLSGADCQQEPFGSPFTYVVGQVSIDGEVLQGVGVRKKGFLGSLSEEHPSLKLKFDHTVDGARFSGFERMTLNNVQQDPSGMRQCLGFGLQLNAGVPAPRCAFASVAVNGQELGVYAHVDSLKKRFLRRHFDDDEGDLWEGTLSDFREGWTGTFEQKTNRSVVARRDRLEAVASILDDPASDVAASLEPLVDLDRFYTYWTLESLMGFWDGYAGNANNFFVYDDPTSGRLVMMPWGVDSAFTAAHPFMQGPQPTSVMAQGLMARRLYTQTEGRERYLATMQDTLTFHWDEQALLDEIDRLQVMLRPHIQRRASGWDGAVDTLRAFIEGRRAAVEAELMMGGVTWTEPVRPTFCVESLGTVRASFDTLFGSHPAANMFFTGTGTFEVDLPMNVVTGERTGSASGFGTEADDMEDAVIIMVSELPSGALGIVYLALDPTVMQPGAQVVLDGVVNRGALLRIEQLGQPPQLVGLLVDGQVDLQQAGASDSAPVVGSVQAQVFPFGG